MTYRVTDITFASGSADWLTDDARLAVDGQGRPVTWCAGPIGAQQVLKRGDVAQITTVGEWLAGQLAKGRWQTWADDHGTEHLVPDTGECATCTVGRHGLPEAELADREAG
jgi:hypothetical protein